MATDALAINLDAPCWLVRPANKGYGRIIRNGKAWPAHRYMWTIMRGPVPEGMQLDHLCRVRNCVNPQHLEVVTCRENLIRGEGFVGQQHRRTHCPKGHPLSGDNLVLTKAGERRCRTCKLAQHAEWQRKNAEWVNAYHREWSRDAKRKEWTSEYHRQRYIRLRLPDGE